MLSQALAQSDVSCPAIKLGTPFSTKAPLETLPEKESLVAGTTKELKMSTDNCTVLVAKVGLQQPMLSNLALSFTLHCAKKARASEAPHFKSIQMITPHCATYEAR